MASAISPVVGEHTFAGFFSKNQSWMHRTIASISKDVSGFSRLSFCVFCRAASLLMQICHGPLEYGKDIAVLVEDNNEIILQMYQVRPAILLCQYGELPVPRNWRRYFKSSCRLFSFQPSRHVA